MPYARRDHVCVVCSKTYSTDNPASQSCSPQCSGKLRRGENHTRYKGGCVHPRSGYKTISVKGKPILEHRYVMQQSIGRPLTSKEVVHHKDGNRLNNSIENLELLSSTAHHAEVHRKYYQTPTHRQCSRCSELKPKSDFYIHCSRCKPCDAIVRAEKENRVLSDNPLSRPGAENGYSKLTNKKVLEIRRLYAEGQTSPEIARQFDIATGTAWNIIRGKTWKHLPVQHIGGISTRRCKLTWAQVRTIRDLRASGYTYKTIADEFGVTPTLICAIIKQKIWKE